MNWTWRNVAFRHLGPVEELEACFVMRKALVLLRVTCDPLPHAVSE